MTDPNGPISEEPGDVPAPQEPTPEAASGDFEVPDDISGIDNWLEEGAPLEPSDVVDVEVADASAAAEAKVAELTLDLQRLQAEFVNYKRRVDRDRDLIKENAAFAALTPIIEVLDTIDRAREHGPLEGGFQTVAEQLERAVAGRGLTKFGAVGDAFDPMLHEALSHIGEDPDVQVTTAKVIAKSGYKFGERVVRAAQVLVVDPAAPAEPETPEAPEEPTAG